ncbi:MAG: carbamoyltransferase [Gammaproteobacteria bacterium]|jgi:carbamoyltransferase
MLVLGWHGGVRAGQADDAFGGYSTHDAAAVLLDNGTIVAAIEEERLNRIKHCNFFPTQSIQFCLQQAGVSLADIDLIAVDAQESVVDEFALYRGLVDPAQPVLSARELIGALFEREFGIDVRDKLKFCKHHLAHIYGAVYCSGQESGLAVALDGEGDQRSGMVATFRGASIQSLREYSPAQSLGAFYTSCIALLGYRRFDEYKVMGLAPYGNPARFADMFRSFYTLLPDGEFEIVPDAVKLTLAARHGLLKDLRRKGEPFLRVHEDLAAAIQDTLERLVMHVVTHYAALSGERQLVFSGGVAHNCTLNGKLLECGLFDRVFVQPAAHDAGNALGAALAVGAQAGARLPSCELRDLYLGTDIGDDEAVESRLRAWSNLVSYQHHADIATRAAGLLADGKVLGWVQGRSEFGPRALGNRSILADPRPKEFKHVINSMVKKREGYRPFAPSVAADRLHDFFDLPESCRALPFMIFVVRVRQEFRELLGAVTHVDGTARVQTVDRATNPKYHQLIDAFEHLTGMPMLLNTSFNNDVEPIVDSVDDALVCFLTTGIDRLVVGNYLVKKTAEIDLDAVADLVPSLRAHQKLVRRAGVFSGDHESFAHTIESIASSFFVDPRVALSADAFAVLVGDSTSVTIAERCLKMGIRAGQRRSELVAEFVELWRRRAVVLQPVIANS